LPFILAALAAGHLLYLHVSGSSNPMGTTSNADKSAFHPYFTFKDLVTIYLFFIIFTVIVFYAPDKLGLIMAVLPCKRQNYYNTVCLNNIRIFRTQVINVIKFEILLYLVKIVTIIILFISRKPVFFIKEKGSSETTCVDSYLLISRCVKKRTDNNE
jgi:quinol-cytochrome oxidoreductase complex cytochrome b subunit